MAGLPSARMAAERLVDAVACGNVAMHEGEVSASHRPFLQLADEMRMRAQVVGDDEQAAGVFVETVHDAATRQLCGFRKVVQKGV